MVSASACPPGASCGLLLTLRDTRPSLRPPLSASQPANRSLLKKGTARERLLSQEHSRWNFQEAEQNDRNRNPVREPTGGGCPLGEETTQTSAFSLEGEKPGQGLEAGHPSD